MKKHLINKNKVFNQIIQKKMIKVIKIDMITLSNK
jgi:hypothetical protein